MLGLSARIAPGGVARIRVPATAEVMVVATSARATKAAAAGERRTGGRYWGGSVLLWAGAGRVGAGAGLGHTFPLGVKHRLCNDELEASAT